METKLRIAFVKDWHDDLEHLGGNKDGILAAFDELAKRHDVYYISRHTLGGLANITLLNQKTDVIICWGSLDRPWHSQLPKDIPALLCFAGGPTEHPNLKNFRHVFCESQVYLDMFRAQGVSCSRAFGTNTQIFRPEPRTAKVFMSIYPASFCFHKNQEVFARAIGAGGLCVGAHNELDIVGNCLQFGTPVLRRVSSGSLCDLYNMSRTTCVPCGPHGGSQRVVLESFACGVPVILSDDNDRCREFVQESGFGKLVPPIPEAMREAILEVANNPPDPQVGISYIRSKWTEAHYADALEKGIHECLTKL